jgi:hypothetical protein
MHLLLAFSGRKLFLYFFQLAIFQFLLAGNAVAGPGHGFQPFRIDLIAAIYAFAKFAVADTLQGSLNRCQQLAIVIALRKEKLLGVRACRTVGNVLRSVLISDAAILFRTAHGFAQDLLALFQTSFKAFQLLLVHVFW